MSLQGALLRELEREALPILTTSELSERLGAPVATIRNELATLFFDKRLVTVDRAGRYRPGDPTDLIVKP